ncbi:alpha/beta hydrolase [Chitinophaga sedimenti]|uniref:alpha/beta hydrolase n=1 Tax=Chitinophaga sedimenti TaxID=2033606 RepID=UPI002004C7F2|nr:alpha/beta hydrolase [Chitinophaga sedimenti]MCK7556896.1 alpha/beta hydrolase [Chitinophaga sedimenti]
MRNLLFLFLLIGCTKSNSTNPDTYPQEKMLDVAYGTDARQKMDVYLAANHDTTTPFIVFIHGGGWTAGNKEDMHGFRDHFLTKGISSASISYRYVSGSVHHEELMADVTKAINLIQEMDNWHSRKTKFILCGGSAGAHMALLYTYKYASQAQVGAVISMAGPTKLDQVKFWNMQNLLALSVW